MEEEKRKGKRHFGKAVAPYLLEDIRTFIKVNKSKEQLAGITLRITPRVSHQLELLVSLSETEGKKKISLRLDTILY